MAATAIAVPTVLLMTGNNGYISLMNHSITSMDDFKKHMEIVKPFDKGEFPIKPQLNLVDPSGKNAQIAEKAFSDNYCNVCNQNNNYLKQDLLYSFALKITDYKNNGYVVPKTISIISDFGNGVLSNLSGDFSAKLDNLSVSPANLVDSERQDLLLCNFTVEYKSTLNADFTFRDFFDTEKKKIKITTNLNGKLEFKNLYLDTIVKDSTPEFWKGLTIDIWSATHKTKSGEDISSTLISTAEGETTVNEVGTQSIVSFKRTNSESIKYEDGDWLERTYEDSDVYKDPITVLVGSIQKTQSYTCQNLSMKLEYKK